MGHPILYWPKHNVSEQEYRKEQPMRGLMMDYPLTLTHFLERSNALHARKEIISRTATGVHRTTYGAVYRRVHRLAGALAALGVQQGERVATLCWNHYRHLE